MITYTIKFTDAVTGQTGTVHFPAVTQLMAQAWAELCFANNSWSSAELHHAGRILWAADK
jgi:hypothetical protein